MGVDRLLWYLNPVSTELSSVVTLSITKSK